MDRQIAEIQSLATKHSKAELGRMVSMGLLDPQKAMMAGMMIDRIQKQNAQPPQSTVAEDVLGLPGMEQRQQQQPQQMQEPEPAGVEALPAGNIGEYAGGGIVALADGGDIPGYAGGNLVSGSDAFKRGLATQSDGIVAAPGAPAVQPAVQNPTYLPDNIDFEKGAIPVYRAKVPEKIDLTKAAQMREEAATLAGANQNFYENLRKDVLADKEDFTKQKSEAKGLALLQLGIGLMGAREGQEFQTLSAAGAQALSSYGSALKEIKASEKEMKKSLRELNIAEESYKRSNADKDLARVQAAEDKLQANEQDYTKALNDGVARKVDLFKDKRQRETQVEVAEIGRSGQIESQKIAAGAPGTEQKMLQAIHAEQVAKNPENPPTMAETYERMKTTGGKAEARAKYALALEKEWNDMGVMQGKFMKDNPTIKSGDDYIKEKMRLFDQYYGKPGKAGDEKGAGPASSAASASATTSGGVVVQTPQGAVSFKTQAEADAFRQKFGLK
jgi:hypothetical protein